MDEKVAFINKKMRGIEVKYPRYLYKYRKFDEYTFDMLNNNYLFMCPAIDLDDETECITDISLREIYSIKTKQIKISFVEVILETIRPFAKEQDFEKMKNEIFGILGPDYNLRSNFLTDMAFEIQETAPGIDVMPIVNALRMLPEQLDNPKTSADLKEKIVLAMGARDKLGICSLGEELNNEDLWKRYAKDSSGYCVEYDFANYDKTYLYPVIYNDEREFNLIKSILNFYLNEFIYHLSTGKANVDTTGYIRLFLSKYSKWKAQNEWRIFGNARDKIPAPKIKCIYLGKNVTEEDKKTMLEYCLNNQINIKIL